jgi:hypothetical protein
MQGKLNVRDIAPLSAWRADETTSVRTVCFLTDQVEDDGCVEMESERTGPVVTHVQ